jgi:putative peptide zinc metalloprotease protein
MQGFSALGSATIRLRPDIQWIEYQETGRWVALDPIANAFYYFRALEYQTARLLDGTRSVQQVFEAIQRVSLCSPLSTAWIETFVQKLLRSQLVETPSGFQTNRLPAGSTGRSHLKSLFVNPLSIRIPLLRPSIDYAWARIFAGVFFSPYAIFALSVCLIIVSYLVGSRLLSRPNELLYDVGKIQGDRWLVLAALLVVIKSIHELGHYLACVHLKVRCAEIGVLFLCFTPCLYCDTTESWRLDSRWKRAGIAAAGIYFEFWIALLGGWIFLNTQSGLLHLLGGGMWLMCTLGTLMLNANPFFRYDGYFILSDLIRAPNLAAQSSWAIWESLIAALGGRRPNPHEYDLSVFWLSIFALVSMIYRASVLGSIAFLLWNLLVPAGLGLYFLVIATAIFFGIAKNLIAQSNALAAELFTPEPISPRRLTALSVFILGLLIAALTIPLPDRAVHRGYIEYSDAVPIYAPEDGTVTSVRASIQDPEDQIHQAGELIVELDNPELRLERINQEHQYLQIASRVEVYKQAAVSDESISAEIPTLEQMQAEALAKLKLLDEQITKLKIVAPAAGRFIAKSGWSPIGYNQGQSVRSWQPTLSSSDHCKRFKRGELIGWFTKGGPLESVVLVSAETVRSIDLKTSAVVLSDASPSRSLSAKITYISTDPIPFFPNELVGDPMFVLQRDDQGLWQSDTPVYKVRLELPRTDGSIRQSINRGGLCSACFELPRLTIGQRIYRFVSSQFTRS